MNNVSYRVVNQGEMYPYVIFDNWYTEEEEKKIWSELDFYTACPPSRISMDSGDTAKTPDGESKIKGFRWYPNEHYNVYSVSPILATTNKTLSLDFRKILIEGCVPYGMYWTNKLFLPSESSAGTIVTYYDEDDEYLPHSDSTPWTQCVWMIKDEDALEKGSGDLEFPMFNHTVPLKHNRCIFFPGCYTHASKLIKFKKQNPVLGDGKYTITTFYEQKKENNGD